MKIFNQYIWCVAALLAMSNSLYAGRYARNESEEVVNGLATFNTACDQLKTLDLPSGDSSKITSLKKDVQRSLDTAFTEEELITAMETVLTSFDNKLTKEVRDELDVAMTALARRLSRFKITGFAFAVDPNGAFFVDTQDPAFTLLFKNNAGEIKTQRFQADIESIGLKVQLSLNLCFIFFVGADLSYLDAHDKIEFGVGGEIGLGAVTRLLTRALLRSFPGPVTGALAVSAQFIDIALTYVPFKKNAGGLLMASLDFGLSANLLSVVTGGSLNPVE